MPIEMIHFRDSDKIIRKKKLDRDVKTTLEYVYDALQGPSDRNAAGGLTDKLTSGNSASDNAA